MFIRSIRNQKPVSIGLLIFAVAGLQLLWGCATTSVDPKLVAKFQPPTTHTDQETMAYAIRTSGFVGAARSVWVACNDRYMAELPSGSSATLKSRPV